MDKTYRVRKNYPAGWDKYIMCDENGRPVYGIPNLQTMHDEISHLEKSGHTVIKELNKYPDVSDLPGRTKAEKVELYLKKVENDNRLPRKFGYIRVSTVAQAAKGNSLEEQKEELEQAGVSDEDIYKDVFTGTTTDRPELNKLLDILKDGDTLIVTKLDRIARSVTQGSELIQSLIDRGVHIKILAMGDVVMDNSPAGKLIMHIFLSFAEFERDMIVQRTQEGRITSGHLGGRPKISETRINHALELLRYETYSQVVKETGISESTLLRAKRQQKQQEKGFDEQND